MGFALILPSPAWAHDTEPVGPLRISFGWGDEPPFTGVKNFVEVEVADAAGQAIADLHGELRAEVSFGDQRVELPLLPDEEPGRFRAALIPTRPGTYAFRIIGNVRGRAIDVGATCSDQTFECVSDATEVQFPAKDPSVSQLSDRLTRELPRASDKANEARQLAIAALVVALLALAAAIGFGLRNARKRG
jgi:hypothetical protein